MRGLFIFSPNVVLFPKSPPLVSKLLYFSSRYVAMSLKIAIFFIFSLLYKILSLKMIVILNNWLYCRNKQKINLNYFFWWFCNFFFSKRGQIRGNMYSHRIETDNSPHGIWIQAIKKPGFRLLVSMADLCIALSDRISSILGLIIKIS